MSDDELHQINAQEERLETYLQVFLSFLEEMYTM